MTLLKFASVLFLFTFILSAEEAYACATARIVAGSECDYLGVEFNLAECADEPKKILSAETRGCSGDSPEAFVKTSLATYSVPLKKADSGWQLAGPVRSGGKRENKEVKSDREEEKSKSKKKKKSSAEGDRKKENSKRAAEAEPETKAEAKAESRPDRKEEQKNTVPVKAESSASGSEATKSPFSLKGHFRFRFENRTATGYLAGLNGNSLVRLRPTLSYQPEPGLQLVFEPQFAKTFGEVQYVGSSATANTATQTSGNTYNTDLAVNQAYLSYMVVPAWQLVIGREALSYGDELVVGTLAWNNIGRSFDLVRSRVSYGLGWSDVFLSKTTNNNTTASMSDDDHFYGLYNHWGFSFVDELDLYWLYAARRSVSPRQNFSTIGLRAKSRIGSFDYRVEGGMQAGALTGNDTHQVNAELGWNMGSALKRFGVQYFLAGKDYNSLYPTSHKWLGYADVLGRRNVAGFAGHLFFSLSDSTKLALDYHYFQRASTAAPAYQANGTTPIGTVATSTSKKLGQELDLVAKIKLKDKLTLEPGVALFMPSNYLKALTDNKNAIFGYVQLQADF